MATIKQSGVANGFTKLVLSNLGTIQTPSVQTALRQVAAWCNNIASADPIAGHILTAVAQTTNKAGPVAKWVTAPQPPKTNYTIYEVTGTGTTWYASNKTTQPIGTQFVAVWRTVAPTNITILFTTTDKFNPLSFKSGDTGYFHISNTTKLPLWAQISWKLSLYRTTSSKEIVVKLRAHTDVANRTTFTTTRYIYIPSTFTEITPIQISINYSYISPYYGASPEVVTIYGSHATSFPFTSSSTCTFRAYFLVMEL